MGKAAWLRRVGRLALSLSPLLLLGAPCGGEDGGGATRVKVGSRWELVARVSYHYQQIGYRQQLDQTTRVAFQVTDQRDQDGHFIVAGRGYQTLEWNDVALGNDAYRVCPDVSHRRILPITVEGTYGGTVAALSLGKIFDPYPIYSVTCRSLGSSGNWNDYSLDRGPVYFDQITLLMPLANGQSDLKTVVLLVVGHVGFGMPDTYEGTVTLTCRSLCDPACDPNAAATCDDGDPCTIDVCEPTGICRHDPDPEERVIANADPHDCLQDVCFEGVRYTEAPANETPNLIVPDSPTDCRAQACYDGEPQVFDADDEKPPQASAQDCRTDICLGGKLDWAPDDQEKPPQVASNDCLIQVCDGGFVTDFYDDSETPPQVSPNDCYHEICRDGWVDSVPDPSEPGCS